MTAPTGTADARGSVVSRALSRADHAAGAALAAGTAGTAIAAGLAVAGATVAE